MKPIGISFEFIVPGKVGGAEFFAKNLLHGLLDLAKEGEGVTVFGADESFPENTGRVRLVPSPMRGGNRFVREWFSQFLHRNEVRGMIYPNYFTPPWPKPGKIVTVIHDAQYHHFPDNFSWKKRRWLSAAHRLTLLRADRVVATSNFVRRDLLEIYGARWESKITAIPIPVSWERFDLAHATPVAGLPSRYVLSVAAQYPHKNLATLIRAFKPVANANPGLGLVLAGQLPQNLGGANRGADLRGLVAELGLDRSVTITGHVSDKELSYLYHNADLFVFPSLFEGFGIPPVEALGFGLPVLTTRCASLPEVTLGLANYVENPRDSAEMAKAMQRILRDPAGHRKSPAEIRLVRETYDSLTIARRYLALLTE